MKFTKITKTSKNGEIPSFFPGWLEERFKNHYAKIGTINTLKLKNSCRDVARFKLGSVPPDIEKLAKGFLVPPQGVSDKSFILGYDTDEGHVQGSIEIDGNLQQYISKYPDHWEIVQEALSLPRSKGRHAAGYVISNEPIDEFIPTTNTSGVKVLDFSGPDCESVGAVKYDFLVVRCLSDIQKCIKLIQKRCCGKPLQDQQLDNKKVSGIRIVPDKNGRLYDIWDLPNDPIAFDKLSKGDTATIFQFDSPSARQWLREFEGIIHSIEDMAVFTALDRPGTLNCFVKNPDVPSTSHNILVEYSRRAKGLKGSPDIVKEFDTLCSETKGVMIFQETLMEVYRYFTNCTLAEAEAFRGDMGKKKREKVEKAYALFMERGETRFPKESVQAVWDAIVKFAGYSFNKSHATAYCVISYACLWLRQNYPLEWFTSVLSNATKDEMNDKFWPHCGHLVLLPDVKLSKGDWEIEGDKIRAPISILYGIGETAHKQLSQSAPYTDLKHFCQSIVDYQKSNLEQKDKIDKKTGETVKVTVWGRNALNIGKIHSMLYAGSMDSFFDKDTTIELKEDAFHAMMKEVYAEAGGKYKKPKKKLPVLDALGRYQAKKDVLPPYGEDLRPLLATIGLPEFLEVDGSNMRIRNKQWSKEARQEVDTYDPVISGEQLAALEVSEGFDDRYVKCGIICYIEKKEKFNWGPGKSNDAYKFFVEFGGMKRELVGWPDFNGTIPLVAKTVEAGSVVAMVLNKTRGKKDFAVRGIEVIRGPIDSVEEVLDKVQEEA